MNKLPLRQSLLPVAGVTGLLLLVPLVAMQFTTEVSWGMGDFLAAAALIFAAGSAITIAVPRVRGTAARAGVAATILFCLALIWADLAVGLFR